MNIVTNLIGYSAAAVGTCLMLQQVFKAIQTKHMRDVSGGMLWAYVVNCLLWDTYGILLAAVPMIICNTAALGIGSFQLYLKKRYQ